MWIDAWEARDIQLEVLGAASECLPKLVARLKHARVDDDAEDERKGEVILDAWFFPHRTASPAASPLRKRTKRDVRKDSCSKENIAIAEFHTMHMLHTMRYDARAARHCSFKTGRLWVARTRSRVVCGNCEWSVAATQGVLLKNSGQFRFKHPAEMYRLCLMTADAEHWEAHECSKPGQLRKDCSVYKQCIAEKGHKPKGERVDATAVVQGEMVEQ